MNINNLTPTFRARLEKWRQKNIPDTKGNLVKDLRTKSPLSNRPVRGDYGDDARDVDDLKQKQLKDR